MRSITMSRVLLSGAMALGALAAIGGFTPGVQTAEAASSASPFAGSWSGTWIGLDNGADGTLSWTVSDEGVLTGRISHTQVGDSGEIRGHIRDDGFVKMVAFAPSDDPSENGCGAPLAGPAEIDGVGDLIISLTGTPTGLRFIVNLTKD